MKSPNYTPEQDLQLIELTKEGLSSAEIAKIIGKTRNSIIGRRHRLQFKAKPYVAKQEKSLLTTVKKVPQFPKSDLCQFPYGDVGHQDFYFCSKPIVQGQVYCLNCCQTAYPKWGEETWKKMIMSII